MGLMSSFNQCTEHLSGLSAHYIRTAVHTYKLLGVSHRYLGSIMRTKKSSQERDRWVIHQYLGRILRTKREFTKKTEMRHTSVSRQHFENWKGVHKKETEMRHISIDPSTLHCLLRKTCILYMLIEHQGKISPISPISRRDHNIWCEININLTIFWRHTRQDKYPQGTWKNPST
jgi:hypothetical protein